MFTIHAVISNNKFVVPSLVNTPGAYKKNVVVHYEIYIYKKKIVKKYSNRKWKNNQNLMNFMQRILKKTF